MSESEPRRRIAILFEQFAAYHVDRCEAAAARLGCRAEVIAIEVARTSRTYAREPSGEVKGPEKRTLVARRALRNDGGANRPVRVPVHGEV